MSTSLERYAELVREQLGLIGEDPSREGLLDTPMRVAKAMRDLCAGYSEDPKEILARVFTEQYDSMVVVRGIEFASLCEHHMLPFNGVAHVGYIPNGKVVGLSKIPRLVQCFARRLQVQERMTTQIANAMMEHLSPLGVGVVIEAHHACMSSRGVKAHATMATNAMLGVMLDKPEARAEFLDRVRSEPRRW